MNDLEWVSFIKEILAHGKNVNLKNECKKRHVSLNTLYRKVSKLEETDIETYKEFMNIHPYKPRDRQEYDFEQLMRESILTGISQSDLETKYHISKRTIQRNFAKVEENNLELYTVYETYVKLKRGERLNNEVIDKIASEYIPQTTKTEEERLKNRRKKFAESMEYAGKMKDKNYYKEQIERIDRHIRELNNNGEVKGEKEGEKEGEEK